MDKNIVILSAEGWYLLTVSEGSVETIVTGCTIYCLLDQLSLSPSLPPPLYQATSGQLLSSFDRDAVYSEMCFKRKIVEFCLDPTGSCLSL